MLRFDSPARKTFEARYAVFGLLAPNNAPSANAGTAQTAVAGQGVALSGTGSDPDGNALAPLKTGRDASGQRRVARGG